MTQLGQIARLVRSKNAGPFLLTFDIMFDTRENYEAVKQSGAITKESIGKLYGASPDAVRLIDYEPGLAIKATIPRSIVSGHFEDPDTYGGQQNAPLVTMEIPNIVK